jgi:hypothetical protein
MSEKLDKICDAILAKAMGLVDGLLDDAAKTMQHSDGNSTRIRDAAATEKPASGDENFDGWLSLTVNNKRFFDFNLSELKSIRDTCRVASITSEIGKNVIRHYINHIIGDQLMLSVVDSQELEDPVSLSKKSLDGAAKQMLTNWKLFEESNNLIERLKSALTKSMRDGEGIIRLFKQGVNPPIARFVDPFYIRSDKNLMELGVITDEKDVENIKGYGVSDVETNVNTEVPPEEIVFIKRNVDFDVNRGISDFWPVAANLRRIEKLLINTSVMTQIHTAIAMVRTVETGTQASVDALISKNGDGRNAIDSETGKGINSRKFRPGAIVTGAKGTKYEFPAANVDPSKYTSIIDKELAHVAANWVLPVDWLLAKEPDSPLSPGSPVIANFREQQGWFFNYIVELFWKVQAMMGVDIVVAKEKFEVYVVGPRLAVGKVLDEARAQQIWSQLGATSPQEIAAMLGNRYVISRSNVLKHRDTLQPGEVAPGDLGNTNPAQNDGTSKKGGGTKQGGGTGGNTKDKKDPLESDNASAKIISITRDKFGRMEQLTVEKKETPSEQI